MKTAPAEPFDEITAFHEAGHAVVALALDRPVQKVSAIPGQELLGKCEFKKGVFRPSVDWLENEILIALAGLAAEARKTGTYDLVAAGQDLRYVRRLALQRTSERGVERYEKRMLSKVENMLADDGHWRAVEAIAAELVKLGTISGRAARHLFDRAQESAH